MFCQKCGTEIKSATSNCPKCGAQLLTVSDTAIEQKPFGQPTAGNPYASPHVDQQQAQPDSHTTGDGTGGIIPYKNPKALMAYYLGILSGLPLIGLPFGIIAFVFGVMGLRERSRNPIIKGSVHAGIGIGCGGFFTVFWSLIIVFIIVAIMSA